MAASACEEAEDCTDRYPEPRLVVSITFSRQWFDVLTMTQCLHRLSSPTERLNRPVPKPSRQHVVRFRYGLLVCHRDKPSHCLRIYARSQATDRQAGPSLFVTSRLQRKRREIYCLQGVKTSPFLPTPRWQAQLINHEEFRSRTRFCRHRDESSHCTTTRASTIESKTNPRHPRL